MSVYFVYRSHYDEPSGKYLKRFADASVLDWFRNRWTALADAERADELVKAEMGCRVYGFRSLFEAIAEHGLAAPQTDGQLQTYLENYLYVEGEIRFQPHCLQVLTDDDELEMAYYFFDDHFLARHADRAAYLLHEGWQLPGGKAERGLSLRGATRDPFPRGQWSGTTYCLFLAYYDSLNLTDLEVELRPALRGVRLPELCQYLATVPPETKWPFELRLLRAQLFTEVSPETKEEKAFVSALEDSPGDTATWAAYSDWLEEGGRPRAGLRLLGGALRGVARYAVASMASRLHLQDFGLKDLAAAREELKGLAKQVEGSCSHEPSRSLVGVQEHVAQLCLHTAFWWHERNLYHHWIFFDDLWAGAHPVLAKSLLRYASRWDVLS